MEWHLWCIQVVPKLQKERQTKDRNHEWNRKITSPAGTVKKSLLLLIRDVIKPYKLIAHRGITQQFDGEQTSCLACNLKEKNLKRPDRKIANKTNQNKSERLRHALIFVFVVLWAELMLKMAMQWKQDCEFFFWQIRKKRKKLVEHFQAALFCFSWSLCCSTLSSAAAKRRAPSDKTLPTKE